MTNLFLGTDVVGGGDDSAIGAIDNADSFVERLDIIQQFLDPIDAEIIAHYRYQSSLSILYLQRMGGNACLRTGTDIRLRPIAAAIASERSGVPIARIVVHLLCTLRRRDDLIMEAIRAREVIGLRTVIDTRRILDKHIVDVRIAVNHQSRLRQHLLLFVHMFQHEQPHQVSRMMEIVQFVQEILLRQLHFIFHHFAKMLLLDRRRDQKLNDHCRSNEQDSYYR